ncbi:MAG: Shedu anti-phage system protein SduA domain-containing protein [Chloroflexota bacterium]
MEENYPPDATLDDIKVAIQLSYRNPNIGRTFQCVLKKGPRSYKIATIIEIMNSHTGELHHYSLRLDSFEKLKAGWKYKPTRSINIDGSVGEIERLVRFISGTTECDTPDESGQFRLVDEELYLTAQNIAKLVQKSDSSEKSQLMRAIIEDISDSDVIPADLQDAFHSGSVRLLESISTSARIVQYNRALEKLREMVDANISNETTIQHLLGENPWLFGSAYSELIDRRSWTRDDQLDFMLRRTVDGYLEIIEIKTPFSDSLFRHDSSHDNHYPSAQLSKTIGQVMRYIEEVERNRDSIVARDGYDPLKIRARIILGRDHDEMHQKALHNLNAHLIQIEIVTFDQLVKIGERVLGVFKDTLESYGNEDEDIIDDDYPYNEIPDNDLLF